MKKLLNVSMSMLIIISTFSFRPILGSVSKANILNTVIETDLDTLDSSKNIMTESSIIIGNTEEGLLKYDKNGKIESGLAKQWTHSSDYKTWIFELKDKLHWSNGTDITTNDFVFSWKRALDPKTAAPYASQLFCIKNAEAIYNKKLNISKLGVKILNSKKLEIQLEKPIAYFESLLTFGTFLPINEKFYNSHKDYAKDEKNLLYSGPFIIKQYKVGQNIILQKNENYWDAKDVKLNTINVNIIKNDTTASQKFLRGDLDIIGINSNNQKLIENKNVTIKSYSDGTVDYIQTNMQNKIMANKNIRKALSLAIDRDSYVNFVLKTGSQSATGFVPPLINGISKSFRTETGNLISSKENKKLAQEYFDKGLKELKLSTSPKLELMVANNAGMKQMGTVFQEMWKKNLGLNVSIYTCESNVMIQKIISGNFQMFIGGWSPDYNDATTYLDMMQSNNPNNFSKYNNSKYNQLLDLAENTLDKSKRLQYLENAEKILIDDMPIIPIYFSFKTYATNINVKDFVKIPFNPYSDYRWTYIK